MSKGDTQRTYRDLTFVGVSGPDGEIVTFGAPSRHDPRRTNLVRLDTRTGAIDCNCRSCEARPQGEPRCWLVREIEDAWLAHPAMAEVRWLTDAELARYGKKLAAMVGVYRARTGRVLPPDIVNLAAARSEWRNRARLAAAGAAAEVAA